MGDIALQEAGTFEAVFDIAMQNGLSVTSRLFPGDKLGIDGLTPNPDILDYYKRNNLSPATIIAKNVYTGIEFMRIEDDFKVR